MNRSVALAAASVLALGLSACGGSDADEASEQTAGSAASSAASAGAASSENSAEEPALTWTDGWVKATEDEMTGVFGTIENTTDHDITLVKGSSDAAGTVELHEVVSGDSGMQMRPVEGGMTVPAGGALELEPGGLHIMLMELGEPVVAGDEITLTLEDAEGASYEWTAEARTFAGGGESYQGGEGHSH